MPPNAGIEALHQCISEVESVKLRCWSEFQKPFPIVPSPAFESIQDTPRHASQYLQKSKVKCQSLPPCMHSEPSHTPSPRPLWCMAYILFWFLSSDELPLASLPRLETFLMYYTHQPEDRPARAMNDRPLESRQTVAGRVCSIPTPRGCCEHANSPMTRPSLLGAWRPCSAGRLPPILTTCEGTGTV